LADSSTPFRNRLAGETSPYLLQHAENPVDWYPWGEEAFAKARAEDRPILLSVGYSSCHWCHVMAHESFENPAIAERMNRDFVNVKVDREERPDVDSIYMTAVQALTGQGGWPMTIFMTPDGKPFYAGTYFPPEDGHGRPGFPRLLEAIAEAWRNDRANILASAEKITDHLRQAAERAAGGSGVIEARTVDHAVALFQRSFDPEWGGFGGAPKFPSPSNLEFLLSHHARKLSEGSAHGGALEMVLRTLRQMASGGMYDQLGGGFARYSVDAEWVVPHFEKMLYDNAQLARVYLHAYQLTGDGEFERIVRETLDYLEREMLDAEGGFYSAQDADSEGIEGKYFVWTIAQVEEVLGSDAPLFCRCFGVTPAGNFRDPHHPELMGRTVLTRRLDAAEVASAFGLAATELDERIASMRARMVAARARRVPPGLDDKVLTSWNGLAMAAFAEAARVLDDDRYRAIAAGNADFVRERLWRSGRLLHAYKNGISKIDGMLEDYAYYGLGLLELYRLTGDFRHLTWAGELFEVMLAEFHDPAGGGFFDTAAGGDQLLVRQKSLFDAATPGGNGAAALLGAWLARYFARPEWDRVARDTLALVEPFLLEAPSGFGCSWQAIELRLSAPRELIIVGEPDARRALEREAARRFMPSLLLASTGGGDPLPHFEGREPADRPLAYLCRDMVCQLPVSAPQELARQLSGE
jgi:uncharacterized protein YyaL (SSP411 family)